MPAREPLDALVIGAGLTGLAAAWGLARNGRRVAVLEAAPHVGGAVATWIPDKPGGGWLFELGPNTVVEKGAGLPTLIAEAGLAGERLVAAPAGKRRYVWHGGALVPLPSSPPALLATRLFSTRAKLRLLREPWIARSPSGTEESIADFVRRRLGPEILNLAVGPFVSGVWAGDPERLSLPWTLPALAALERDHGSLLRGLLARKRAAKGARTGASHLNTGAGGIGASHLFSGPSGGAAGAAGAMVSFRRGQQELPRALAAGLDVRTATPALNVRQIETRQGLGFAVTTAAGEITARHLILTVDAEAAAALLAEATGGASRPLSEIPYARVAVIALGFRRDDVAHPLDGFGFLAPRGRGPDALRLLGCLFPSQLFPGRAPAGHVALSAFVGGRTDPEITSWDDERLLAAVLADLRRALGVRGAPVISRIERWPRAIPQYELGHGRFADLVRDLEARLPGLHVAGNFLGGVAVPDCVERGLGVARRIVTGS